MIYYALINGSGLVVGNGIVQDEMESYFVPPTGMTRLNVSEVRYQDMKLMPEGWKANGAGTDVVRKAEVPVTINKTSITANGIDALTISNVPNPSEVSVVGSGSEPAYVTVTDGSATITTEDAGAIQVSIRSVGYSEWRGEFSAV